MVAVSNDEVNVLEFAGIAADSIRHGIGFGAIADQLREHVWPVLAAGRCLPIIDKVYPLTEAAQAHARMEGGDHIGKIVLRVE
mgnify:CR=1 FL=1